MSVFTLNILKLLTSPRIWSPSRQALPMQASCLAFVVGLLFLVLRQRTDKRRAKLLKHEYNILCRTTMKATKQVLWMVHAMTL